MKIQTVRLGILGSFGTIEYLFFASLLAYTGAAYYPGYGIASDPFSRVILSVLKMLGWVAFMVVAVVEKRRLSYLRTNNPPRTLSEVIEELRISGEQEAREAKA